MTAGTTAKILIADDFEVMRAALCRCLNQLGFANIIACADGAEALARLRREPDVALVISDWKMEPVDGFALLQAVRGDDALRGKPFILVTAESEPGLAERAVAAGASFFMRKPFDAGALLSALAMLGIA